MKNCKVIFLTAFFIGLSYFNVHSQIAISTLENLKQIGNNTNYPLTGSYYLTNDIEIPDGTEWIPIGATNASDANPKSFSGTFDGKGYSIKNLKISTVANYKGLFGTLNNATIRNLSLEVNIKGGAGIGGVAGSIQGETLVERVAVKGNIEGTVNVAGIAGIVQTDDIYLLHNKIRNCYINASIKATNMQAGGVVARSNGCLLVEKVYVAGKIEAPKASETQNAAGIVSLVMNNLVILQSSVVAVDKIEGGVPNFFYSNDKDNRSYLEYFEDLYARNDISLQPVGFVGYGRQIFRDDMLIAPSQLKDQSFYEDDLRWDFNNVWIIGNDGYPQLRSTANPEESNQKNKLKVACVGNSITENASIDYYLKYPSRLQDLLGRDKYAVRNYGLGGSCMLKSANASYWKSGRFMSVTNWSPDILFIKFGTNDTADRNWVGIAEFENNYTEFVNLFKTANPNAKIYICYPIPIQNDATRDERVKSLQAIINRVAQKTGATVVDLYTAFSDKASYYVDNLHPGVSGAALMSTMFNDIINADYWQQNQISISNYEDLKKIGNDAAYPLNAAYYLTKSIEIPNGEEWVPIGATSSTDGNPNHFTGVFDGKGYSIKNLKISSASNVKGLFGRLGHATVTNLDLANVDIKGDQTVGAIAGAMFGESRIEKVSVSGNIEGTSYVGGIVGRVAQNPTYTGYNIIEDCYVKANVKATSLSTDMNAPSCAGGIVGFSVGNTDGFFGKTDIRRVYVSGKVVSEQMSNAAGNSAGILSFYDNHYFIKMDEVLVLSESIQSATPNLFFSRRGPAYDTFERLSKLYARTGIELNYLSEVDKGRGGEMPSGMINYNPIETYKTKQFYTTNLSWDFENTWTIKEGSLPVLKRADNGSSIPSIESPQEYKLFSHNGGIDIQHSGEFSVVIYALSGKKVKELNTHDKVFIPIKKGVYMVVTKDNKKQYVDKILVF